MANLISKIELNRYRKLAIEASFEAGKILIRYQKKLEKLHVETKTAQGVMSEADLNSEKAIIKMIKKVYPDHDILAEESSFEGLGGDKQAYDHFKQKEWCWCIDPLDGTNNFLGGMDYYGVCISLMHRGKPVVGVVYRPSTGELYHAVKGDGARYRQSIDGKDQKLKVIKQVKELKDSLLVTGFASEKGVLYKDEFPRFQNILMKCRGVRRMGSAALDMCLLAQGIFDGFWERGISPWDVAASGLIAIESGAKITDWSGQVFNPFQETIVAARTPIYLKLRAQLR